MKRMRGMEGLAAAQLMLAHAGRVAVSSQPEPLDENGSWVDNGPNENWNTPTPTPEEETFSQRMDRKAEERRLDGLPRREDYPSRQAHRQAMREALSYNPDKWKVPDMLGRKFKNRHYR